MKRLKKLGMLITGAILMTGQLQAQDIPHYVGKTLNNPDYHTGQLKLAKGVHNIQVLRASREHPEIAAGFGWTYNHAPMLAYWNNQFYLEYLSDSVGEHIPPGQTFLVTSKDGYNWNKPEVLFPEYKVPDGTTKPDIDKVAHDVIAVMHQRMGFYVSKDKRLLALAYYGISLGRHDSPNDHHGIGRVVRELYKDGTMGPIYFIHYNHNWNTENTDYPFYKSSKDKGFVKACDELMSKPLETQQWNEESDVNDPLIHLKGEYKALSYYHLSDGRVVGFWKHALTAISDDEGLTWEHKPVRAPGFVNSNAKIWGQRTSDGKYAAVYNPSDFRWPLAISTSNDGLRYDHLWLVNGEITTMRYGGNYKSYGPQYVRGIQEGNGTPPDGNLWVAYSMNKEDMWVSSIPVPVTDKADEQVNEVFNEMAPGKELDQWNFFSPVLARVNIEKDAAGTRCLVLHDKDAFDYAKAERLFPAGDSVNVEFTVEPQQADHGQLNVELQNAIGTAALRLTFTPDGKLQQKNGYRQKNIMDYEAGKKYDIRIDVTADNRFFYVYVDGKRKSVGLCFAPVHEVQRVTFRTGEVRRFPNVDTPTDQDYDVKDPGKMIPEAKYNIYSLTTKEL